MSYLKKMTLFLSIIKIYKKLAVEMFKVSKGLSSKIINEIFQFSQGITNELREIKRKTSVS